MTKWCASFVPALLLGIGAARAETVVVRAALDGAKPVAECALQKLAENKENTMPEPAVLYMLEPPPENPLDNYERTALGDWRMPAAIDRGDPWLRLVVVGPKKPVLIDLAIFVDGRPFRESRESWIDELLKPTAGNNADPAEGTKTAENSSDKESASDNEKSAVEKTALTNDTAENGQEQVATKGENEKPAPAGVAAQRRKAPSMSERLKSYLAAGGGEVDRNEVRWLIAEWGSGPPALLLGPSLSWQRAGLEPLMSYLDRDHDGAMSAAEIGTALESLQRADIDGNDVLDANEIRRAADRPAAVPFATDHSLVTIVDEETDFESLAGVLERAYGAPEGDSQRGGNDPRGLLAKPADVTLRIDFGTRDKDRPGVSVVQVNAELGDAEKIVTATNEVVTLDLGGDYIEFSAAEAASHDKVDVSGTQVAIGAAIDGNPLLRLLDRDNDHRLTKRERQELPGLLSALDRDGDGAVGSAEMPMPIRFAVTRGPRVHQLLATPVGAARAIAPRDAAPSAPAWFISMDKNGDKDLSRSEFLGTSEQFKQIDSDGDGLVSVAEAMKLKAGQ